MPAKVLIVDDHDIVRYALRTILKEYAGRALQVVAEAHNGRQAVAMTRKHRPDLVIMDIVLPELNGLEATRQIRTEFPATKVIILSMYNRREYLRELIAIGICGYVLKTRVFNELIEAVEAALNGDMYLSPKVAGLLTQDYARMMTENETAADQVLSPRQREVLQMLAEGKGTKEIAMLLKVSPKAVESVRHRIMTKLNIDNLADLTKYAIQEGLTSLDF